MRVKRFVEYNLEDKMVYDFINSFDGILVESDGRNYKMSQNKIISDLKLNSKLVGTFGTGIASLYPIVDGLMKNMRIDGITTESIVLFTITAFTITYIEERKFKSQREEEILTKDSKSMLEELKMMGIGNGLVKKLMKGLQSIKNIFLQ